MRWVWMWEPTLRRRQPLGWTGQRGDQRITVATGGFGVQGPGERPGILSLSGEEPPKASQQGAEPGSLRNAGHREPQCGGDARGKGKGARTLLGGDTG